MGVVRLKPGAKLDGLAAGGFRLLGALDRVARAADFDLTITEGTGAHPPNDPHTLGKACDVRTHGLTEAQKQFVLKAVMLDVEEGPHDAPMAVSIGWATTKFYGQLEHPGQANEHLHFQVRKGVVFP